MKRPVNWKRQSIDAAVTGLVIATALLAIGLLIAHRDLAHAARLPVAIVVLAIPLRLTVIWLVRAFQSRR